MKNFQLNLKDLKKLKKNIMKNIKLNPIHFILIIIKLEIYFFHKLIHLLLNLLKLNIIIIIVIIQKLLKLIKNLIL